MKKHYSFLLTAALAILAGCSKEVATVEIPDSDKNDISFSISDGASQTKAGFAAATKIAMRIQSEEKNTSNKKYTRTVANAGVTTGSAAADYSALSFDTDYVRYWDDAFGRKGLLSVYAVAVPSKTDATNNGKTLENLLAAGDASAKWGANDNNTIDWQVTLADQSATTLAGEDLTYSNNIKDGGTDGIYRWSYTAPTGYPAPTGATTHKNGRMLFFQETMTDANAAVTEATSAPGHFDKGHLKFNHALSRMTITLVKGDGFGTGASEFSFASGTGIKLINMNVKGNLNIATGAWTVATSGGQADINKLAKTVAGTNAAGTYAAQMLPGFVFTNGDNTNVMEFTIDNNQYFITQDMLFDALTYDANSDGVKDTGDGDLVGTTDPITMEQGKNYNFTITVKKKQIESITATLAAWVDVKGADFEQNNAHLAFTLTPPLGGTPCSDIFFYRHKEDVGGIKTDPSGSDYTATAYSGNYLVDGGPATLTSTASGYQTNWYFDDNRTAYHFRTVNELASDEGGTDVDNKHENIANTAAPAKSYFTMRADATVKDYHWGAPMKNGATLKYSPVDQATPGNGFADHLFQGIMSTNSPIKIQEMHMMSNINVILKTKAVGDPDAVVLSGATVTLTNLSTGATVDMGTGAITPAAPVSATQATTVPAPYWETTNEVTKAFSCSVIPQVLKRNGGAVDTDFIGITITTSDHNQYYMVRALEDVVGTVTGSTRDQANGAKIQRWYPGHNYTYTFTITKNKIDQITCVVADWVNVVGANQDLDLEK